MAPKRSKQRSNTSLAAAASSEEDTISGFQVVQRPTPTKSPLAAVPSDEESDGSDGDEFEPSDGIRENDVPIKRQPPPKRMAVAKVPMKDVEAPEASPLKKTKARSPPPKQKKVKAAAQAAQVAGPPSPEKSAAPAAPDAAKLSPRKKKAAVAVAATTEAANPPRSKKAAVKTEAANSSPPKKVAGASPPTGPENEMANVAPSPEVAASAGAKDLAQRQEGDYDAEKHFKEKSQTYKYLWQMVLSLEKEHSLFLKKAFLKISDAKASILDAKLKKLSVMEIKQQLKWNDTDKEVIKVLLNSIK